jgi:hypothetical protein
MTSSYAPYSRSCNTGFGSSVTEKHLGEHFVGLHFDSKTASANAAGTGHAFKCPTTYTDVKQMKLENFTLLNCFLPYVGYGDLTWQIEDLEGVGVTTTYRLDISNKIYTTDNIQELSKDMNGVMDAYNATVAGNPGYNAAKVAVATCVWEDGVVKFFSSGNQLVFETQLAYANTYAGGWFGVTRWWNGSAYQWGITTDELSASALLIRAAKGRSAAAYNYLVYSNVTPMVGGWPYVVITLEGRKTDNTFCCTPDTAAVGTLDKQNVVARLPLDSTRYGSTMLFTKEYFSEIFLDETQLDSYSFRYYRPDAVEYEANNTTDTISFTLRQWYTKRY